MSLAAGGAQILGEIDSRLSSVMSGLADLQNTVLRQNLYEQNAANLSSAVQAEADTNQFASETAQITSDINAQSTGISGIGQTGATSQLIQNVASAREANISNLQERGNIALGNALTVNAANTANTDASVTFNSATTKMLSAGGGILGSLIAGGLLLTQGGKEKSPQKVNIPGAPSTIFANQVNFNNGYIGGRLAPSINQGGMNFVNAARNNANDQLDDAMSHITGSAQSANANEVSGNVEQPAPFATARTDNGLFDNNILTGSDYSGHSSAYTNFSNVPRASFSNSSVSSMPVGAEAMSDVGRPGFFTASPNSSARALPQVPYQPLSSIASESAATGSQAVSSLLSHGTVSSSSDPQKYSGSNSDTFESEMTHTGQLNYPDSSHSYEITSAPIATLDEMSLSSTADS